MAVAGAGAGASVVAADDSDTSIPTLNYLHHHYFIFTTLSVKRGIKDYGDKARQAIIDELSQMLKKGVFRPVHYHQLSDQERSRVLRSIMFLKLKRDGRLKGRLVADGRPQALYGCNMDISSPTASTESVFVTLVIDATEDREVAVADIEGAYLEAVMTETVHIEIDEDVSMLLLELMPEWAVY